MADVGRNALVVVKKGAEALAFLTEGAARNEPGMKEVLALFQSFPECVFREREFEGIVFYPDDHRKLVHDPEAWARSADAIRHILSQSPNEGTVSMLRQEFRCLNIVLARSNLLTFNSFCFPSIKDGQLDLHVINRRRIEEVTRKQKVYKERDYKSLLRKLEVRRYETAAPISIAIGDTIEVSRELQLQGFNPAAINMANQHRHGGGFLTGSAAQEESLCRRTFLYHYLSANLQWYPMEDRGLIYNPEVLVFRGSEREGSKTLEEPFELAFLTCAAPAKPFIKKVPFSFNHFKLGSAVTNALEISAAEHVKEGDELPAFSRDVERLFEDKIRAILLVALENGHDSVVLGAWGCGAFGCPPLQVALLHRKVIFSDPRFLFGFKKIVFAIIEDHNSNRFHNLRGNVLPFQLAFSDLTPVPPTPPFPSSSSVPSSSSSA